MARKVTNGMLLERMESLEASMLLHMQSFRNGVQEKIATLSRTIESLDLRMTRGFEEAKQHRQALQEDLDASIRMLGKHDKKLSRL